MEDNQNIEKFFKDKLNQPIKQEPWNTPDDSVWTNIASSLDNDKEKTRVFPLNRLLILFLLASLLTSAGFHLSQQKRIKDLHQQIAACNTAGESETTSIASEKNQFAQSNVTPVPSLYKKQESSQLSLKKIIPSNKVKDALTPQNENILTEGINSSENKIQSSDAFVESPVQNIISVNNLIAPPVSLLNSFIELDKNPSVVAIQKPDMVKRHDKTFLGLSVGSVIWLDREQGTMINPLSELLIEEKTYNSTVAGLRFSRQLNEKWSVTGGLEYYRRTQHSLYSIALPYSKDTEIDAGSNYENHFQHSLPTGLGNVNTFLVLARSRDSELAHNEIVSLDFAMNQQASVLSIPAGISYFPLGEKFGPFINGGLRTDVVIDNRVSDINLRSHHPLVQDNHINVEYNNLQMSKLNLSLTLGLGYQLPLWRDIHVSGIIQYGQALNPVFRSENYIHDINSLHGQLIVFKKL